MYLDSGSSDNNAYNNKNSNGNNNNQEPSYKQRMRDTDSAKVELKNGKNARDSRKGILNF